MKTKKLELNHPVNNHFPRHLHGTLPMGCIFYNYLYNIVRKYKNWTSPNPSTASTV